MVMSQRIPLPRHFPKRPKQDTPYHFIEEVSKAVILSVSLTFLLFWEGVF